MCGSAEYLPRMALLPQGQHPGEQRNLQSQTVIMSSSVIVQAFVRQQSQLSSRCFNSSGRGKAHDKLECGPMHNVMAALPNTGGALCSTPQSLAEAHY